MVNDILRDTIIFLYGNYSKIYPHLCLICSMEINIVPYYFNVYRTFNQTNTCVRKSFNHPVDERFNPRCLTVSVNSAEPRLQNTARQLRLESSTRHQRGVLDTDMYHYNKTVSPTYKRCFKSDCRNCSLMSKTIEITPHHKTPCDY